MSTRGSQQERTVTRILIVDDHPIVRRGLCALIEYEEGLEVCGEAEDFAQAVRMLEEARPDIALIDLALHDSDGMDVVRYVKEQWVGVKLIVVSSRSNPSYHAAVALKAGAAGYVTKQEAVEHIIDAIHTVSNGKAYISSAADCASYL